MEQAAARYESVPALGGGEGRAAEQSGCQWGVKASGALWMKEGKQMGAVTCVASPEQRAG